MTKETKETNTALIDNAPDYTVTETQIEAFNNAMGSTKDTVNGKRGADIKRSKAAIQKAVAKMDLLIAEIIGVDLDGKTYAHNATRFALLKQPKDKSNNEHAAIHAWGYELIQRGVFGSEVYDAVNDAKNDPKTFIGHETMKGRTKKAWQTEFGSRAIKAIDRIQGRILPATKGIDENTTDIIKLLSQIDKKMHGSESLGFHMADGKDAEKAGKAFKALRNQFPTT